MAYCGYITRLKNLRPHSNADRLQIGECFGNSVVVSLDYTENQLGVYFPSEGQLGMEFCVANDLLRRKDENGNPAGGYMDERRCVTAIKLRGEKSDGLFLPLTSLANFTTISDLKEGDTITILNGVEICKKYIPKIKNRSEWHGGGSKGHKTKVNFAPTFAQHVETQQLAYHLNDFRACDVVELSLKLHGTSARTGYLPLIRNKKRTLWQKIMRKPADTYTEYGYVTGTRRVVLDEKHDGGFYDDNQFRLEMAKKFEGKLHKGETVYYEIVGFVNENTPIMASVKNSKIKDKEFSKMYGEETVFSYGCDPNGDWEETSCAPDEFYVDGPTAATTEIIPPRCQVYVYRMTMSNDEGDVVEMSPEQMRLRCDQMGVKYVPVFEKFMIPDMGVDVDNDGTADAQIVSPGEYVLRKVEQYFDGPDPIGKTHIREGVVARIVNRPNISVYKHKNHTFKQLSGIIIEQVADGETNVNESVLEEL